METQEFLIIDDTKYETKVLPKFRDRKGYEMPNPKLVKTFIPGTVINLYVSPGDSVQKGAKVLLLEAMKMKNAIRSDRDGVIAQVNINAGDSVKHNQPMFTFQD